MERERRNWNWLLSLGGAELCKHPGATSNPIFFAKHEIKAIYNLSDNYIILIPS